MKATPLRSTGKGGIMLRTKFRVGDTIRVTNPLAPSSVYKSRIGIVLKIKSGDGILYPIVCQFGHLLEIFHPQELSLVAPTLYVGIRIV